MSLLLAPFIELIEHLFLLSYKLTQNYGLSIVILSLAISLLLLPIFIFIEKAKKKDDAIKLKMKPLVDEIKRTYKGQERFYYLKTLNRQFKYSAFRSLIPILSLLLQIPFFIAAYQYLESYEPLKGISFLFISDLSLPDHLFGALNFLPLAMTFVNLLTAYFYTRNGDGSERKQMLVVAGIFLVLLFNLPSGLVLYWTMNNVFSFFRLFITNPEVFKNTEKTGGKANNLLFEFWGRYKQLLPKAYTTALILIVLGIVMQLNWSFHHTFENIVSRISLSILFGLLLSGVLTLFAASFKLNFELKKNSLKELIFQLWPTFKTAFIIIVITAIISQLNWALKYSFDNILQRMLLALAASVFLTFIFAFVILLFNGKFSTSLKKEALKITSYGYQFVSIFLILAISTSALQINWAYHHIFNTIVIRISVALVLSYIFTLALAFVLKYYKTNKALPWSPSQGLKVSPWISFSFIFMAFYLFAASKTYYNYYNSSLGFFGVLFLIPAQIFGYTNLQKSIKNNPTFLSKVSSLPFFSLVGLQILNLIVKNEYLLVNEYTALLNPIITYYPLNGFLFFGLLASLLCIPFYPWQDILADLKGLKSNFAIYFLAILFIFGFVFLWNPLSIYSSYPTIFEFPAIEILRNNISLFGIAIASFVTIYLILPKRIKPYLLIFILVSTALSFIHNTLLPINVGSLQDTKFLDQNNLAQPEFLYLIEGFAIIALTWSAFYVIKKQYFKQLKWILILINLILITQSIFDAVNTKSFLSIPKVEANNTSTINFSKDKENVVFVILDMFHGWYMDKILKENPTLNTTLEGFKWYPNTLSVSSITCGSISPLLGGFNYTIDKLNQDKNRTLGEKVTEVSQIFYNKIKAKGYNYTATEMIYSTIDKNTFDTFLPVWNDDWDQWNSKLNIGLDIEIGFTLLWENAAFYSVPLILKPKIYNNGRWFHGDIETNENTNAAKTYNFLRILPYISNTQSKKPNFIFLHSMASHHPWDIIDGRGKFKPNVSVFENNEWTIKTLSKWIEWMKQNGVYNNTKIVVVSDHGPHWWHYKGEIDYKIPIIQNPNLDVELKVPMQLYPLMLVKDFNSKGSLEKDWRFMSNADATAILFDENDPTKGVEPKTRKLPSTVVNWERKISDLTELKIMYQFEVTNNAFDQRNWQRLK